MAYSKQTWTDGSGGGTPLSAARLTVMENGIEAADLHARTGTGSPESSVTAPVGDFYTNTTTGDLWHKASGTGNTGWEQVVGSAVTDHGALTGLSDDDHPQYARIFVQATEPTAPRDGDLWAVPSTRSVPAFVQEITGHGTDTSGPPYNKVLTWGATTTAGNALIVTVGHPAHDMNPSTGNTLTVTDSASNTYTLVAQLTSADSGPPNSNAYMSMFVCFNTTAATTVTATVDDTSRILMMQAIEVSGIDSVRTASEYAGSNYSLAATNEVGDFLVTNMVGYYTGTLADCNGTGTGWTFLTEIDRSASNDALMRGAYQVADAANEAGASWSPVGSHGLITTSFVPGWE